MLEYMYNVHMYEILPIFDQSRKKEEDEKVLLKLLLMQAKNILPLSSKPHHHICTYQFKPKCDNRYKFVLHVRIF